MDRHDDCPGWAVSGECGSNIGYMFNTCPRSCNVCNLAIDKDKMELKKEDEVFDRCQDSNKTMCKMWGKDACMRNPQVVIPACPRTCGACSPVCQDWNVNCTSWMLTGACEDNPIAMGKQCPQSCGICNQYEGLLMAKEEKDEL